MSKKKHEKIMLERCLNTLHDYGIISHLEGSEFLSRIKNRID